MSSLWGRGYSDVIVLETLYKCHPLGTRLYRSHRSRDEIIYVIILGTR